MAGEYRIPYSEGREQGTWKYAGAGIKAHITCPDCGGTISLHNHTIDETGVVDPAVACPTYGCGFYRFIQLYNWRDIYEEKPPAEEKSLVDFYVKSDAPEGGDGSKVRPLRSPEEIQDLLGDREEARIIFMDKKRRKKAAKKKAAKKKAAKKKAARRRTTA